MQILVAGDDQRLSEEIRQLLVDQGIVSGGLPPFSLNEAVERCVQIRPGAIALLISPDAERSLAALREIRELISTPILVIGPASDPKLILRSLREGAFDYLDQQELHAELAGRLSRIFKDFQPHDAHGRLISIVGAGGGCGASTLAVNIATALAKNYKTCGLFDLNLYSGDLSALLDVEPRHSIAEFCQNMNRVDQTMFQQCLSVHESGVHLMAAPRSFADARAVTPQGIRKALSMAKGMFPYTIVDVECPHTEHHAQGLYQSELVLLVLRLDFSALRQTGRVLEYLSGLGVDKEKIELVAGRYRRPRELPVAEVEKVLKMKIKHFVPEDARYVNESNNRGMPIVLKRPRAKSSRSMIDLAWSVNGHHAAANGQVEG